MAFCPTCRRSYPDDRARCPIDATPLRAGQPHVEATQSLAMSGAKASHTADVDPRALSAPEVTRAESPASREKLATGSSPDEPTSHERPGKRRRSPSTVRPEERVGNVLGPYRLVELIGRGGMGCVYRAEHIKLGRSVALKLLRSTHAERRDAVARFFQEARAVNRIRHRNIVDVTDFVELEDGTTFIIMELLEGASLRALMRMGAPLEEPRVLAMMIQICDALAAAHAEGIVHRDLKPDNIFVVPIKEGGELVKLLDFGVAKLLHRDSDDDFRFETAAGAVIGTPAYMSPEQAGGLDVDGRSDIYSLGAIMYELFTGEPPFRGKSFGEYVRKHLSDTPVPPSQTAGGADIDPVLEELLLCCLEKDPAHRFSDAGELRAALVERLAAAPTSISVISDSDIVAAQTAFSQQFRVVPTPHTAMAVGDVEATPAPGSGSSQWRWLLATAGAACLAAVAIVYLISRSGSSVHDHDPEPPSRPALSTPPAVDASQSPSPTVSPIPAAPALDVREALITVRFESTPVTAHVYRGDEPRPLCETPCNVSINTMDGGNLRNFTLRADGYRDEPVTVYLKNPESPRHVQLSPVRSARRPAIGVQAPKRDKPRDTGPQTAVKPKEGQPPSKPQGANPKVDPTTTIDPFSPK